MAKVTVLTVTKRGSWAGIAVASLEKQTFKDFNWVVVYEPEGISQTDVHILKNCSIPVTLVQAPKKTQVSNLNASENAGLRVCTGEYVILFQDLIRLEDDCFQKLVDTADPKTFVSTLTKNPEGEEEDPRYLWMDEVRDCLPSEWEGNVSIAPYQAYKDIGGYDERLDAGWAWDNVMVAEKAAMLGYKFKLDETNRPQLIFHTKEPDLHPELESNGEICDKILQDIRDGKEPIKASFL